MTIESGKNGFPVGGGPGNAPEALVMVVAERDAAEQARQCAERWQGAVPRAEFAGIELGSPRAKLAGLRDLIREAADRRTMPASGIVLLGEGRAGRLALDLVLGGGFPGAGILAVDVAAPPVTLRPIWTAAVVRLVQHASAEDPDFTRTFAAIEAVRGMAFDLRFMLASPLAERKSPLTSPENRGYLVELVARASAVAFEQRGR